jgi:dolichyl-phosphate-mannose-protein mannosyltransferase
MNQRVALSAVFVAGIAIRLPFLATDTSVTADPSLLVDWAGQLSRGGLAQLVVATGDMVLYPPLSTFMLWVAGWFESPLIVTKALAFAADLGLGWVVARQVASARPRVRLVAAGAIVLNPALWYLSAVWGQIDSVFVLFMALAVAAAQETRPTAAWATAAAAFAWKVQAIVLAPILVVRTLRDGGFAGLFRGVLVSVATVAIAFGLLAASAGWDSGYVGRLWHREPDLNITALNAWFLVRGILELFRFGPGVLEWLTGGGGSVVGVVSLAMVILVAAVAMWRAPERVGVALPAATVGLGAFLLLTGMRERYLIGVVPLLALASIGAGRAEIDRGLAIAFVAVSTTQTINLVAVGSFAPDLWFNIFSSFPQGPLGPLVLALGYAAALVNLAVLGWAVARLAREARSR